MKEEQDNKVDNENKENKENKNLPVVHKEDKWRKFRKRMQRSVYMALSVFGIVFPYVDQAADMMQQPPPSIPPVKEVMKEDMEAKYEQAFSEIGITVQQEISERENIEIPDDPPEAQYDIEYKGEDPKISARGGDDELDFYKRLTGYVEDDAKIYKKFKEEQDNKEKNKKKEAKGKTGKNEKNDITKSDGGER